MSTLQLIKIYTNNLKELHKKICENTQISWKAVCEGMCRARFKIIKFILFWNMTINNIL